MSTESGIGNDGDGKKDEFGGKYIVSENIKWSDCLYKADITHFVIISLAYKQYWQLSLIFKCTYKIKEYSDSSDW